MATRTRPVALAAPLLALALAAGCSGGGDDAGRDDPAGTTVPAGDADAAGGAGADDRDDDGGTRIDTGGGDGAQTDLDVDRSDTASALERRVSATLSELDAEQRGADTVVVLPEQVLFAFGDHELLPEAIPVLDGLVEAMGLYAAAPVQVNGHTDAIGSDAANQALSERRAQAVTDHFVGQGVDPARIHAQGFGESQPVAPNAHPDGADDPDGRSRNRRVEVVLENVSAGD
jgi:outer membrane protein OmpA-like peptidoglycan-associated protein